MGRAFQYRAFMRGFPAYGVRIAGKQKRVRRILTMTIIRQTKNRKGLTCLGLDKTIKRLRLEKGWTQDGLSRKLGVTPKAISFYELGERRPSRNSLIKLAQIFGVTIDELVNEGAEILEQKMPSRESDLARDIKKILLELGVVRENTNISEDEYDEWLRFLRIQTAAFREFKKG